MNEEQQSPNALEDKPPVFEHWYQVYIFVLLVHLSLILLFYWITLNWNYAS